MTLTQEEKQLLLQDICGRLPYKVKCLVSFDDGTKDVMILKTGLPNDFGHWDFCNENCSGYSNNFKPYLRPMSSMTEEENKEIEAIYQKWFLDGGGFGMYVEVIDWLNAHHFDYRGLIPMDLAMEAPEDMYK